MTKQSDAQRKHYLKNRERILTRQRAYDADHAEQRYATTRAWVARNSEKVREYQKTYRLRKKYGISVEEWDSLVKKQKGRCALCRTDQPGRHGLVVDHNHETGDVRGLLCSNCNTGLGLFGDDPSLLRKAARYLAKKN